MAEGAVVGMIGCGRMGRPIVLRLLASGAEVVAYDLNPAALAGIEHPGLRVARSVAEVADAAPVVLGCLASEAAFRQMLLGEAGIGRGRAAQVYVHLGTTGPRSVKDYAAALEGRVAVLDAPISGGVPRARDGTLASFVSGDGAVFARVRPTLEAYSSSVVYLGAEPGAAQVAKLVNNLLSAAHLALGIEGMMMGAKSGLDLAQLAEVLRHGTGQSNAIDTKVVNHVLPRRFNYGGAFEIIKKDLGCWHEAAEDLGLQSPVGHVVHDIYMKAIAAFGLGGDMTDVARYYETLEGMTLPLVQPKAEPPGTG